MFKRKPQGEYAYIYMVDNLKRVVYADNDCQALDKVSRKHFFSYVENGVVFTGSDDPMFNQCVKQFPIRIKETGLFSAPIIEYVTP